MIIVKCDYCNEGFEVQRPYLIERQKIVVDKLTCKKTECKSKKFKEIQIMKNELGLINVNDNGYWQFSDNALTELKKIIEKSISDNIPITDIYADKIGVQIMRCFKKHNLKIYDEVEKLGFDPLKIFKNKSMDCEKGLKFIRDKDEMFEFIDKFIGESGRFPTRKELVDNGVSYNYITIWGGIQQIKSEYGYDGKEELLDDSGYYNASVGEYYIAQLLINNNIKYLRNVKISDETNHNCDFVVYPENGEPIWIEYWGGLFNSMYFDYKDVHLIKQGLYKKYNKRLINIYYELFNGDYSSINNRLYIAFRSVLNVEYDKNISYSVVQTSNKLTDEELLYNLLDGNLSMEVLPTANSTKENGKYKYYDEALKRYGSYYNFAEAMGKSTVRGKINSRIA